LDGGVAVSLIQAFKDDSYTYGNLQSIAYNRNDTSIFKPGFLGDLYWMLKGDRFHKTRPGSGILEVLMCGMSDISFDQVVSYLARIPLCVMGIWEESPEGRRFRPAGIHFITVHTKSDTESSCFAGYGFVKEFWGSDEQETLTLLGISQIFGELNVKTINGMRFTTNEFTARYMAKFGFKDTGLIKDHLPRRGKLVDGVVSTLSKSDFETNLLERVLSK
jgi:hypothetical protein